jgi:protein gp37
MSNRLAGMARADQKAGKNPGRKAHYLDVINSGGKWNGTVRFVPEALADPLKWKTPRRVFVNSMSDLFHEGLPFEYIDQVFAVMALCPQHTFQILTKRPERMADYLGGQRGHRTFQVSLAMRGYVPNWDSEVAGPDQGRKWPLSNVWLGTSIENRACLDRAMELSKCPAIIHFWSLEPLLEDLGNIRGYLEQNVEWVISGGESGPGSRPCNTSWVRSIVRQCKAAGVACFVKQMGGNPVSTLGGQPDTADGTKQFPLRLKDKKGGDMVEWPEDIRVREFPKVLVPA